MSSNFFYGRSADIVTGSANFASLISTGFAAYGLTTGQASAYGTLNTALQSAYSTANEPTTRTSPTIAAKQQAIVNMRANAILLAKIINATPTVTNEQLLGLGLLPRMARTPIPAPGVRPAMDIIAVAGRTVSVSIHDSASSNKRGKPAGVSAAWIYSFVGANYPADPTAWNFEGSSTKAKFDVVFPTSLADGSQVWLCAAWINNRQQSGPVSMPITANIAGGGMGISTMKIAA
jgi:hypothetical protein